MSSVTSNHTAGSERPERSRNAKAQARHRAKRKAYIDQLEQTVTKLQIAVGFSTDQISALPPPLIKLRELEQDNARLQRENDELRRLLDPNSVPVSRPESNPRMGPYGETHSTRSSRGACDPRDYGMKRRRFQDGVYMNPNNTSPQAEGSGRPPPLTIPQPLSHQYGGGISSASHSQSHSSSHNHGGGSIFGSLPGGVAPFQMPNTPSGSSATSSPPFSPTQMHNSSSHQVAMDHHRGQSHHSTLQSDSNHHGLSSYSSHYGNGGSSSSVKVEEEGHYHHSSSTSHPQQAPSMYPTYTTSTGNHGHGSSGMDWHGPYGSAAQDRTLHRP